MFFSLEMLDKSDPPAIPDGYGLSLGFYCLMETVKTIQILIDEVVLETENTQEHAHELEVEKESEGVDTKGKVLNL